MQADDSDEDDESCELGKHSHWENVYQQEVQNLETTGDEGEVWCVFVQLSAM